MRPVLLNVAARLLDEEGPHALSARRIAAEAGCSTSVLYTHFDGMAGLMQELVSEGFSRLDNCFLAVKATDDPVTDMALLGRAYRWNARENRHLYAVMFGSAEISAFALGERDRQQGRYTLTHVMHCAERCISADRFSIEDAELVAHQMWLSVHGLVSLELGDYLPAPYDADRCFEAMLVALMVGVGDTQERAARSVALSRPRLGDITTGRAQSAAQSAARIAAP